MKVYKEAYGNRSGGAKSANQHNCFVDFGASFIGESHMRRALHTVPHI